MNKEDICKYLVSLDKNEDVVKIFLSVDGLIKEIDDTLSDSFQIACELHDVFLKYAKRAQCC